MAMRYVAATGPCPRRRRSPLPLIPLHQRLPGGRSNATTENVARNMDGDLGWVREEIAKLEKLRLEIEETTRYNKLHKRCLIGSVFAGFGLGGLACAWYTRSYRKALKEHFDNPIIWMPLYSTSSPE
uniref:Uncharacterized protein n=1 Tax=Oryza meridionalis TaxID=40149 RepID=A0A0E0E7I3_9ORYZ